MDNVTNFLEKNADGWEVFKTKEHLKVLKIENNKIKSVNEGLDEGYAVRVIVNGKVGFASGNDLMEISKNAVKIARISEEKLEEFAFSKHKKAEGIYDKGFEESDDWLLNSAEIVLNTISEFGCIANSTIEAGKSEIRIMNSSGLDCNETSTSFGGLVEVVKEDSSSYEIQESRKMDVDFEWITKKAAKLTLEGLKAAKLDKGIYDVVLSPIAVHQLLFFALYPAFSAENFLKGRSQLKIGDKIGEITIVDDGKLDNALFTSSFDYEGVDTKKTVVVDKGEFKSFLTDFKYSKELDVEMTGNCYRDELNSYPAIAPTNVVLEFEDKLDWEGDRVLEVHAFIGSHTSNPVSGDFSLECMNAVLVDKDRIPIKTAMIYGNVYEFLKKIEGFGKDVRQFENTITPSILFRAVVVSG
ncbi:hypothetical protein DRO97_07185 [Archaeoglobales archaeon]|nr:MAG: hypothetical protein DRO97_07185 [Archaeoglobales archaeon]